MDPRLEVIDKRLENVKTLVPVSGVKGGIGKSLVASTLALTLSELGYRVGLMDLDFSGPSTHIILGISGVYPEEERGIVPPDVHGIKFLHLACRDQYLTYLQSGQEATAKSFRAVAIKRYGCPAEILEAPVPN